MKFKVEITMNNQAFVDDPNELSRILIKLANRLEFPDWENVTPDYGNLRDINGNKVGTWELKNDKAP